MFDYQKKVTIWEDSGTEPPEGLRKWQAGEKPPAAWWNWFWDAVGKCFEDIKNWIHGHDISTGVHGIAAGERVESQVGAQAKVNAKMTEHLGVDNPHPQYIDHILFNNTLALINKKLNPPGKIAYFARCNPPNGWLEANGALLHRSDYPDLWQEAQDSGNLVEETLWLEGNYGSYSTGDGSITFRIPDLRAEFIRGLDNGRGVDLGRVLGSNQEDGYKEHQHESPYPNNPGFYNTYDFIDVFGSGRTSSETGQKTELFNPNDDSIAEGNEVHPLVSATGGSETRPRNVALLVCIKF